MKPLADKRREQSKIWEHRTVRPEDTFSRLTSILPAAGITRIADVTDLDRIGIPVFQAVRPMGLSLSVSQGKGATKAAARVSAVMESIEIWHAETETLPAVRATGQNFPAVPSLDLATWARSEVTGPGDDSALELTEAVDCQNGAPVWVPRDVANLDFTRESDPPWILRSTDGLAGGNTIAEALSSALAEVIERSCKADFAICNAQDRARRRLDPHSVAVASPKISALVDPIWKSRLNLELFDMTNAVGVAAIKAVLYDTQSAGPIPIPCVGHGAHLNPETAVARAVTEAAQARLTHISGNRDDLDPNYYRNGTLSNFARLIDEGMDFACTRRGFDMADRSGPSPESDFETMMELVLASGAGPVLFLDLTKDEIGLPVVKVLAPNLRNGHPNGYPRQDRGTQ